MRIDKFLKVSRLIKRRTIAKQACDENRISVNDKIAKAGTEVNIGDIISIEFGTRPVKVKVLEIKETTKKEDSSSMYEVIE